MVKEERSLRTRQWPVRSGVICAAPEARIPAFDRPLPVRERRIRTGRPRAPLVCELKTSKTRELSCPVIHGAVKMPIITNPSRTALAGRQLKAACTTVFARSRR
jgi:hypothetical protein